MLSVVGIPFGVIFFVVSALLILQVKKQHRSLNPRRLRQYASTWKCPPTEEIVDGIWTDGSTHESF